MKIGFYVLGTDTLSMHRNPESNMQADELCALNFKKHLLQLPGVQGAGVFSKQIYHNIYDVIIYYNPELQIISPPEKSVLYVQNTFEDPARIIESVKSLKRNFGRFMFASHTLKKNVGLEGLVLPFASDIDEKADFDSTKELYRDVYDYEVSFLGNPLPRFPNWMEQYIEPIKQFKSAVYSKHPWPERYQNLWMGGLPLENTPHLHHSTKINMNVHIKGHTHHQVVNFRIFDSLAYGGFILSDYFEEIDNYFDGAVAFTSGYEEQIETIKMYLKDDDLRLKKIKQGFEIVRANHTVSKRTRELLKFLKS